MKALSLYANIGVAEAYLESIGIDVVVANELVQRRADLYKRIYPKTEMICGDITNSIIFESIAKECKIQGVELIIATPPCQGMSRAGIQDSNDTRNNLIIPVINMIKEINPKYVFFENVSKLLETSISYCNKCTLILDLLLDSLSNDYIINVNVTDTKDYSVPQTRERVIILMTRKGINPVWDIPSKDTKIVTLKDAIGDLPILDPFISDVSDDELIRIFPHFYERKQEALKISKWHNPPHHIKRQVLVMMHTPTGKTAFDNKRYVPVRADGKPVTGYLSTYRRLRWDDPASTITMDNRKISSQNNVHPGRFLGYDADGEILYSDPRALTTYEIMRAMSLPLDWSVPNNTPEAFLRSVIGEGIPPLFVKKVFKKLL